MTPPDLLRDAAAAHETLGCVMLVVHSGGPCVLINTVEKKVRCRDVVVVSPWNAFGRPRLCLAVARFHSGA